MSNRTQSIYTLQTNLHISAAAGRRFPANGEFAATQEFSNSSRQATLKHITQIHTVFTHTPTV